MVVVAGGAAVLVVDELVDVLTLDDVVELELTLIVVALVLVTDVLGEMAVVLVRLDVLVVVDVARSDIEVLELVPVVELLVPSERCGHS